ncbi:MAG: ShlB/FhaC/HecB family hemolysin secretion/activation protein [Pseudomonadota bacterium]
MRHQGSVKRRAPAHGLRLSAMVFVLTTLLTLPARPATNDSPNANPGGISPLPIPSPLLDSPPALGDSVLPPLPTIGITDTQASLVVVERIVFEGNFAFNDAELRDVVRPYLSRSLGESDLITLRDQIAAHYQTAGYLATRVTLISSSATEGLLRVRVREGNLEDESCIRVLRPSAPAPLRDGACAPLAASGRLRPEYVRARLPGPEDGALNINTLRTALTSLQGDERVQRLDAALTPGTGGDAKLDLLVWETTPWRLSGELGNTVSPSLGGLLGGATVEHLNLTGRGDALSATVSASEGLFTAEGTYSRPVLGGRSRLVLAARGGWSEVVEAPFDALDLTGRTSTFELRLDVPVQGASPNRSLLLGFALVQRSSSAFVFGDPFAFTDGGDDGAYRLSIVRASQSWLRRSARQAIAWRSTFSVGTGLLEATDRTQNGAPDGNFLAWRGQTQWARTLPWRGTLLSVRGELQLAGDPLFGLEAFTLGGINSVRGYRENQLIRDSGISAGVEAQIPVLRRGPHRLALAFFSDAGRVWDVGDEQEDALWSIGAGLRWEHPRVTVSLYAGQALSSRPTAEEGTLQDDGIHLSIRTAR